MNSGQNLLIELLVLCLCFLEGVAGGYDFLEKIQRGVQAMQEAYVCLVVVGILQRAKFDFRFFCDEAEIGNSFDCFGAAILLADRRVKSGLLCWVDGGCFGSFPFEVLISL
jgi:hypothetical protein